MARTRKNLRRGAAKRGRVEDDPIDEDEALLQRQQQIAPSLRDAAQILQGMRQAPAELMEEDEPVAPAWEERVENDRKPLPAVKLEEDRKMEEEKEERPRRQAAQQRRKAEEAEEEKRMKLVEAAQQRVPGPPTVSASTARPKPVPCPSDIMKYHLRADVVHDHGPAQFTDEKFATLYGGNVPLPDDAKPLIESKAVKYIKDNDVDSPDKDFRIKNIISFKQDTVTQLFPQHGGSVFKPFRDIENSEVGILQDAGAQLYRSIRAKNLITFGSILDQAKKPITEDGTTLYFPFNGSIEIDPCIYGFNPEIISKIKISNYDGQKVRCEYKFKFNGQEYDGGTCNRNDRGNATYFDLKLNKLLGDFGSIENVKGLEGSDKFAGFIGKALGDIMLVASITPKIGNTVNSFYPSSALKTLDNKSSTDITHFLLNTGDQLNHIRAFMFGVASVYSTERNGSRKFEYIPGLLQIPQSNIKVKDMYLNRIKDLILQIDKTYSSLISHLKFDLLPGGIFDVRNTKKSGLQLIPGTGPYSEIQQNRVRNSIIYLTNIVESFRTYVLFYYYVFYKYYQYYTTTITDTNNKENTDKLKKLKETYEILMNKTAGLMPSSTSTIGSNKRDVVAVVPILKTDVLIFSDYSVQNKTFEELYRNLTETDYVTQQHDIAYNGSETTGVIPKKTIDKWIESITPKTRLNKADRTSHEIPSNYFPISSTNVIVGSYNFYVSPIYQLIGKNSSITATNAKIYDVFNFTTNPDKSFLNGIQNAGGMVGGQIEEGTIEVFAEIFTRPNKELKLPTLTQPKDEDCSDILSDFLKQGYTISDLDGAVQTYRHNRSSIIDSVLLTQLYDDCLTALGVDILDPHKPLTEFPLDIPEIGIEHTKQSLLFNSFACRYNGQLVNSARLALFASLRPMDGGGEKDDLECLLNDYADQFKELAMMEVKPLEGSQEDILAKIKAKYAESTGINPEQSFAGKQGELQKRNDFSRNSSLGRSDNFSQADTLSLNGTFSEFGSQFSRESSPARSIKSIEGGQRVPAENLNMDWTKSFVRRGGSSPNSEVK